MKDEIVLYQPDATIQLEVRLQDETVWLTQQQMAELFDTDRTSILRHIHNIYRTHELDENATCAKIAQVRLEGNIDAYVGAATFEMMDVRAKGVQATIYSGKDLTGLRDLHNDKPDTEPIETAVWSHPSHDRWLIVDNSVYHCGHSLKDMGQKLSAVSLLGIDPNDILKQVI